MAKITKVTYQCDICRTISDNEYFRKSKESDFGNGTITIKGSSGGTMYGGNIGGHNYEKKYEVCFDCSTKIKEILEELENNGGEEKLIEMSPVKKIKVKINKINITKSKFESVEDEDGM